MPYVAGGQVVNSKTPWRMSIIPDFFWGVINFVVLFFQTMISPDSNSRGSGYTSDHRVGGNDPMGPGGGPRRRMGGFRGGGGGPSAPPMAGGG